MQIQEITEYSDELLEALNRFLPQLNPGVSITRKDLERLIASPETHLFIAKDDQGKITGTYTLVTYRIPTGRKARIEDVVVDESCRGRGIGETLMRHAIAYAKKQKLGSLELTSRPSRVAANNLYRKLGFELRETNVYRRMTDE